MNARLRRRAPDVIHGEDERLVDEAMEHQAVLLRIDRGDAGMMALVEQSVRRDDAVEVLQWCPPGRGEILRQILWDILDNILLEWRRRSIRLASHGIAGGLHPLWNVWRQIIGGFPLPPPPALPRTPRGPACAPPRPPPHSRNESRLARERS